MKWLEHEMRVDLRHLFRHGPQKPRSIEHHPYVWKGSTHKLTCSSTENKVFCSRQAYNDSVMAYNTQREIFPSSVIAGTFHFTAAELSVIEKPERGPFFTIPDAKAEPGEP